MDERYYLIDLERSVSGGVMTYWRPNRHGYTNNLLNAGLYNENESLEICNSDIDMRTIRMRKETADDILRF